MKPEPGPGPDPIISDGTARFTMVLFLALFTLGAVLLIWRGSAPFRKETSGLTRSWVHCALFRRSPLSC